MDLNPRSEKELLKKYPSQVSVQHLLKLDRGCQPEFKKTSMSHFVWELLKLDQYKFEDISKKTSEQIRKNGKSEEGRDRVIKMIKLIDKSNDRTSLLVDHVRWFKPYPKSNNNKLDTSVYEGKILGVCFLPVE